MNDRPHNPPNSSIKKVVDLKPRGNDRSVHSPFGHFSPDDELLQSTARIKSQRDIILGRIEKMQDAHSKVSSSVYEKVRRDYCLQLETINDLLSEKKKILKDEIKKLYVSREKLSFEVNRHREILEEAGFRHYLGEFTQTQFQEVENFETKEIEKLESDLSHIAQWVRTHEDLFDPEDFGGARPKPPVLPEPLSTPQTTPAVAQAPATTPTQTVSAPPPQPPVQPTPPPEVTRTAATQPAPSAPLKVEPVLPPPPAPQQRVQEVVEPSPVQESLAPPAAPVTPPVPPSVAAPAPQEALQKTQKDLAPIQVAPLPEDEPELDEFSYLFEDDKKDAAQPAETVAGTPPQKENLDVTRKDVASVPILTPQAPVLSEEPDLPEPGDDYFKQEKVSESSFTLKEKKDDEDSVTVSKDLKEATDRKVLAPDSAKPVNRDESISNILDSIRMDGDEAKPAASSAASAQTVEANQTASEGPQTEFRLVLTQGDLDQSVYAVGENTSIGRSPSNDVVLKEPKVSRQHAAVNKYNEHYIIIDLKSSNGVYVNGAKVDECVLHPGDEISIGGYKFTFERNQ